MKRFNKINNSGFTLMEVVIAMALVTITATFVAAALTANGKGLAKTQEISKGSDSSLSECERYLAKDTEHGKTEGNFQFKKTSGGLAGFPDITLEIKDSSDTDADSDETNVKYVAFKRLGDENDAAGGGGVSADGGGLTSGSGYDDGGTNGGGEGSGTSEEEEERREEPAQPPVTEPVTEAPTQAPVTEAPTQAQPVTEAQTEAQTQAEQSSPAAGSVYFSNTAMSSFSSQCGWDSSKVIVNGGQMRNSDNVAIDLGYSMISGVTADGVTLKSNDNFTVNSIHDDSWRGKYYITVYLKASGGSNINCTINGVTVTEQIYKVPYDENSNGRLDIRTNGGEVCITGIAVEKFGDKW